MALGGVSGCFRVAVWLLAFGYITAQDMANGMVDNTHSLIGAQLQQKEILTGPENRWASEGKRATFLCVNKARHCTEMIWSTMKYDEFPVVIYDERRGIYDKRKYLVEDLEIGCRLTFKRVAMTDVGQVICEVKHSNAVYNGTAELYVISNGRMDEPDTTDEEDNGRNARLMSTFHTAETNGKMMERKKKRASVMSASKLEAVLGAMPAVKKSAIVKRRNKEKSDIIVVKT